MSDTPKSNLLSGIKSFFIEEDNSTPEAKPVTTSTQPITMPAGMVMVTPSVTTPTESVQPEEIKSAESLVSNWSGFKSLENLRKFSAIEAKLRGKISDSEALRAASFEMAEVAGVNKDAIIDEVKGAVSRVHVQLTDYTNSVKNSLNQIDDNEKSERQQLELSIAQAEQSLSLLRTQLGNLSDLKAKSKNTLNRQFLITQQVATLFIEQWTPLTESKKS